MSFNDDAVTWVELTDTDRAEIAVEAAKRASYLASAPYDAWGNLIENDEEPGQPVADVHESVRRQYAAGKLSPALIAAWRREGVI